jgi:bifunctional UDP-N-acetylglucosamine pyrophosphorylase/glucosamine-1-phosphate N-acetyltransferase/UDP-N-acetylglucosamine pyrophosphorylase
LHHADPTGLGRIVRDGQGNFTGIVEQKDATEQQENITEVNMSTYVFDSSHLQWSLEKLQSNNAQSEYYLTDCPSILKQAGHVVEALPVLKSCESLSVNTLEQLQLVEQEMQQLGY